jgi:hypothetical protein
MKLLLDKTPIADDHLISSQFRETDVETMQALTRVRRFPAALIAARPTFFHHLLFIFLLCILSITRSLATLTFTRLLPLRSSCVKLEHDRACLETPDRARVNFLSCES